MPLCSVFLLPLGSPFCHACLYSRYQKRKQACLLLLWVLAYNNILPDTKCGCRLCMPWEGQLCGSKDAGSQR